jgi:hypothetical protein
MGVVKASLCNTGERVERAVLEKFRLITSDPLVSRVRAHIATLPVKEKVRKYLI